MRDMTPQEEADLDALKREFSMRMKVPMDSLVEVLPPGVRRAPRPVNVTRHDDDDVGDT